MAKSYNLKAVICTVGGVGISGYGEDDAIGLEWDNGLHEKTATADGDYIYSRNNARGLTVTITLSQSSRAYNLLMGLLELQTGDNAGIPVPAILPMVFGLIDPSNGDWISSIDCVFMTRPAPSKGKTVGTVEFQLHLPNPKGVFGALNLLP